MDVALAQWSLSHSARWEQTVQWVVCCVFANVHFNLTVIFITSRSATGTRCSSSSDKPVHASTTVCSRRRSPDSIHADFCRSTCAPTHAHNLSATTPGAAVFTGFRRLIKQKSKLLLLSTPSTLQSSQRLPRYYFIYVLHFRIYVLTSPVA